MKMLSDYERKQRKLRRDTVINGKIIDINFIREYCNKLSDYDRQLLYSYCCSKSKKTRKKKYFTDLFDEIEQRCSLSFDDAKRFLRICFQYSFYPYPYKSSDFKSNTVSTSVKYEPKKQTKKKIVTEKNRKDNMELWVEVKEKEDLDRRLKQYKMKPAQYAVNTTEPPSSKFSNPREAKLLYDKVPEFLQNVKWEKKDIIVRNAIVFHNFLWCANEKHNLSFCRIKIKDVKDEYRVCNANFIYCNDCDKFYIDSTQYKNIRKLNILPNIKIHSIDTQSNEFSNFKQESELSLYGYNAQKSTPQSTRQGILYDVINNKLMSPGQVISHLEGLISLAEYNDRKKDVIQRYQDDIMFIHESFDEAKWWDEYYAKLLVQIKI